jgi:hypothetical protein
LTPEKKVIPDPTSWKRNQRAPKKQKQGLEATGHCNAGCKFGCDDAVTLPVRENVRALAQKTHLEKGEKGVRALLHRHIKPKESVLSEPVRDRRLEVTNEQPCRYCRTLPPDQRESLPPHHFAPQPQSVSVHREYNSESDDEPETPLRRRRNSAPAVPSPAPPARIRTMGGVRTGEFAGVGRQRWCPNHAAGLEHFRGGQKRRRHSVCYLPTAAGDVQVCRGTFCHVMNVSNKLYVKVNKAANLDFDQVSKHKGFRGKSYQALIKAHIKSFPREPNHYTPLASLKEKDYVLSAELNQSKMWRLFCHKFDPGFAVWCDEHRFWPSLDGKKYAPPRVPEDEIPKPMVSHTVYHLAFSAYKLRFGHVKVDTCETCDKYVHQLSLTDDAAESAKILEDQYLHHQKADNSYQIRRLDERRTEETMGRGWSELNLPLESEFCEVDGVETMQQDAGGNWVTPRLTVQQAYYSRKINTYNYDFYSHGRQTHNLYVWNEQIARKGPNEIMSAEYHYHNTNGTGARCLNKWFDNTGGQVNNYDYVKYMCLITDPDIGDGAYRMYQRIDEKLAPPGHTYMRCDAGFGSIQIAAKSKKIIANMEEWMDIAKGASKANPHRVVELTQDMIYDWAEFLKQIYVNGTRKGAGGNNVKLQGSCWRNYGVGEDPETGELVWHPGEVWLRYTFDEKEPWTKLDLRRQAKKAHLYKTPTTKSSALTIPAITPITSFPLYTEGLLPLPAAKVKDLQSLCKHLLPADQGYYLALEGDGGEVSDEDNVDAIDLEVEVM